MIKKLLYIIIVLFSLQSCKVTKAPLRSIDEYNFIIYPIVLKKGNSFYLQYQFDVQMKNGIYTLKTGVSSKITKDKLYYYFSSSTSFSDYGEIHEIAIDSTSYIEKNAIYWLNPDNTEIKLKITQ